MFYFLWVRVKVSYLDFCPARFPVRCLIFHIKKLVLHKRTLGAIALYINQVSATFYPILILAIDKPDFMKKEVTKKTSPQQEGL